MKIEFDTSNAAELTAVGALIASLRGDTAATNSGGADGRTFAEYAGIGDTGSAQALADAHLETLGANVTVDGPAPLAPVVASPAVPPLPVTAIAPPAPSPGGVELDTTGLPYDARIHSKPPSKKANGEWRGKRGLDDATRDAVTAELRAALAAPAAVVTPGEPSEQAVDAATAFAAPVAAPAIEPVAPPPPPPAPVAAVAPPPPPAPVVTPAASDFAGLMRKITALQSAQLLDVAGTQQIAASLGIQGVRDLMVRPDLIPSFEALLPVAA